MELQIKSFSFPLDGELHEIKVHEDFVVMHCSIIQAPVPHGTPAASALTQKTMTVWFGAPEGASENVVKVKGFQTGDKVDQSAWAYMGTAIADGRKAWHAFAENQED